MAWARAMGVDSAFEAIQFLRLASPHASTCVVDPFCGVGTVLVAANEAGMDAVGVDLSRARCRVAESATLESLLLGKRAQVGPKTSE